MVTLPKHWKQCCKDQQLKPEWVSNNPSDWFYLKGQGYHWRVNSDAMFQIGETYAEFDRWALCDLEQYPIPTTFEEFRAVVAKLLADKTASKLGCSNVTE